MNPNRIREAVIVVAEKIRKNESVDLSAAIIGEDVEEWLEYLALATLAKDSRAVKRKVREGIRKGFVQMQITLPGMEHAGLPPVVWVREADGTETAVAMPMATKGQIRREVALHRRAVNVMDRVVGGWESSLEKLDELGVPDDATGAEILEQFGVRPGIEAEDA